jgi:hypothetical protein
MCSDAMLDSIFWVRKPVLKHLRYLDHTQNVPTGDGTKLPNMGAETCVLKRAQGLYIVTDMYPFHRQARKASGTS